MKIKFLLLNSLIAGAVILGGCSSKEEKKENPVANETDKEKVKSTSKNGKYTFKDGKAIVHDADIVITKYKVIPPGEEGNEYGKESVIAFWFDITSKTDEKKVSPISWMAIFDAYQDNNENKVNKLDVASHPDKELMKDQFSELKKGGTLSGAMAYKLTDNTTPVILKVHKGIGGEELGTQEFKIN